MVELVIRPMEHGDKNFVMATALKGHLYGCPLFKTVPHDVFYANFPTQFETLLAHPESLVLVAALKEDPDTILAYLFKGPANGLQWAFTKKPWRGMGLQIKLLARLIERCGPITQFYTKTAAGEAIAAKKGLTFNPWSAIL